MYKSLKYTEYFHLKKARPRFSEIHAAAHIFFQKLIFGDEIADFSEINVWSFLMG